MKGCDDLGHMYASGDRVDKDPAQAAVLFKKACAAGNQDACAQLKPPK